MLEVEAKEHHTSNTHWEHFQEEAGNTYLDIVVNVYEGAALQNRLGQRWDKDLLLPLCMLPCLHPYALHFCNGSQVINPAFGFISDFLHMGEKERKMEPVEVLPFNSGIHQCPTKPLGQTVNKKVTHALGQMEQKYIKIWCRNEEFEPVCLVWISKGFCNCSQDGCNSAHQAEYRIQSLQS